ncbi:Metabotropic glutamate receptor 7, partial [Lamellibrachia satsuma]
VWPYKDYVAVVDGNVTIGGLMMVHERHELLVCGKIMPQGGIQATEAMLYTIDVINARNLIPGVKLGARIKDDCDRDIYGLEQSVDFIRGSVKRFAGNVEDCKDGHQPDLIAGVVGAPSSVTSIQVANLLKLFKIPQ